MPATKTDLKRELRQLYLPGQAPSLVEVPEMRFLMVDGVGNPNTAGSYREAIETLYPVAYTIKFALKRVPDGIDFVVMPLESLWWNAGRTAFDPEDKAAWAWTAMTMQPDRVTSQVVRDAVEQVRVKREPPVLDLVRYERFAEGPAAQVMHIGPYSAEGPTIAALHEFIAEQGLTATGKHHEIYLGDPRRTRPDRLRTVIRQPVRG